MSEHWAELRTLFDELVELDGDGRAARLREIGTRDAALRSRLEAMLTADAETGTGLYDLADAAARSILADAPGAAADPLGLLGTTVGRYRVDGLLGAGGMGVVYRATDLRLGRVAALKFLPPAWGLDPHAKDRFLNEARSASSLDHPNICTIYEADVTADGGLYMAMACYEGETLRERLARGPLAIDDALDLAAQAAHGLAAAHAQGLVHRDIKPANLLVTTAGTLKILDFGIAKAADVGLTMPGHRPGTAAYMAPEQAQGGAVDRRADLWSLGVVFYEMLTGSRPADADPAGHPEERPTGQRPAEGDRSGPADERPILGRPADVGPAGHRGEWSAGRRPTEDDRSGPADRRRIQGRPAGALAGGRTRKPGERLQPPSALRPGVPAALDALVLKLLEEDPAQRPSRAEDVIAILEPGAASDAAVDAASQPGVLRRLRRREASTVGRGATSGLGSAAGRSRAVAYTGVGILVGLVGGGSYVYWQNGPVPGSPPPIEAGGGRHGLAVLPFANTSPDAENEYFADGMTDDVLAHLSQVSDFSVISRTTTMGYKGSGKSVPEIAGQLGVQYVLEGSVRRADDRVRIMARLVEGRTDRPLWTQTFDRRLEDIFAVQTEIAGAIASALEVQLAPDVEARIERRPTDDLAAYDLFLLGRESLFRYELTTTERAIELFRRALDRDPGFALARAWLARAQAIYMQNHGMDRSWADSAVAHAEQAIADQPDLADAHTALGTALHGVGRFAESLAALEQALELNPNDWIASHNVATTFGWLHRWDDALRAVRRSLQINQTLLARSYGALAFFYQALELPAQADSALELAIASQPNDTYILSVEAWVALEAGHREQSLQVADRLAGQTNRNPMAGLHAAEIFTWTGETARARQAAEAAYDVSPSALYNYLVGVVYGHALERTGDPQRAREVLAETERYALEQIHAGHQAIQLRYSLAGIHALRGESDEAFRWLDEAVEGGWKLVMLAARDPLLDSLRDDPRFQIALDRMQASLAPMRERVEQEGGQAVEGR